MSNKLIERAARLIRKHSDKIIFTSGVSLMVGGAVVTAIETKKAVKKVMNKEKEKGEALSRKEVIRLTYKEWILPVTMEMCGAALTIAAHCTQSKRIKVVSTMCSAAETAFAEYKRATKEVVTEKEAGEIEHKVVENRVNDNPPPKETAPDLLVDVEANTLCFDMWSNRYFYSNRETILRAVNNLNRMMVSQDYIPRSEFCYQVHEAYNKTDDDWGFNVEDGLIDVTFDTTFAPDGRPCMTVDTNVKPKREYMY